MRIIHSWCHKVKLYSFHFLNHSGNEGKVQVKDGKAESKVQHDKEENMNKDNNSADVDERTTTKDIISSSMNQINDYISAGPFETGMYIMYLLYM